MGVHVQPERGVAFDHILEGIRRGGVIGEGGVDVHERSCSGVGWTSAVGRSMLWNQRKSTLNV